MGATRPRLLVVDDEQDVYEFIRTLIDTEAMDIETYDSGRGAISAMEARRFDVLVSDLRLTDIGGVEVVRHFNMRHPASAVIVMTAIAIEEAKRKITGLKVDGFLAKPFTGVEFKALLAGCLKRVPVPDASSEKLVLIVEDEPAFASFLENLFQLRGLPVATATTMAEAMDRIRASGHSPDVLLVDLGLPGPSGSELCKKVKSDPKTSEIPVVMMTASQLSEDELRERKKTCGADDFVVKPADPHELCYLVERYLGIERSE
ncbi:MAG: response regulator [Elusimicrobiota bacterium]